jgi:hypothetical protein
MGKQILGRGLTERLDTLGAQRLLDQAALFHNRNLLQVGLEGTIGGTLGE